MHILNAITGFWWTELFTALLIFFGFWLLRKIFTRYIFKIVFNLLSRTRTEVDTTIFLSFEPPLQAFFIVLGTYSSLSYLQLTPAQDALLLQAFRSAIVILLSTGFYNLTGEKSLFFKELEERFKIQLDKILVPFLTKIIRFLIIAFTITLVAKEWGFEVNAFITSLGLGGLAFALAAQDTLGNIFGGFIIITDKPFSIGDWIDTPSVEGTVEDITFRSTKVRTFAHALVTVPNSKLANEPITNWTRMGKRRITFHLGVTYTTPREKLQKCVRGIKEVLVNHPAVHPDTIFVNFDNYGDSSLDIFLYFFTHTTVWKEFLQVKEDINFKIMEILEEEGVSVAFPSRSLYFENPLDLPRREGAVPGTGDKKSPGNGIQESPGEV